MDGFEWTLLTFFRDVGTSHRRHGTSRMREKRKGLSLKHSDVRYSRPEDADAEFKDQKSNEHHYLILEETTVKRETSRPSLTCGIRTGTLRHTAARATMYLKNIDIDQSSSSTPFTSWMILVLCKCRITWMNSSPSSLLPYNSRKHSLQLTNPIYFLHSWMELDGTLPWGIGGFLLSVLSKFDRFNACVRAGVHSRTKTYIDASNRAWTMPNRKIFRSEHIRVVLWSEIFRNAHLIWSTSKLIETIERWEHWHRRSSLTSWSPGEHP